MFKSKKVIIGMIATFITIAGVFSVVIYKVANQDEGKKVRYEKEVGPETIDDYIAIAKETVENGSTNQYYGTFETETIRKVSGTLSTTFVGTVVEGHAEIEKENYYQYDDKTFYNSLEYDFSFEPAEHVGYNSNKDDGIFNMLDFSADDCIMQKSSNTIECENVNVLHTSESYDSYYEIKQGSFYSLEFNDKNELINFKYSTIEVSLVNVSRYYTDEEVNAIILNDDFNELIEKYMDNDDSNSEMPHFIYEVHNLEYS